MARFQTTLIRLALIAATSLAASRFISKGAAPPETCQLSAMEPCKEVDATVRSQDVLFPLAVVYTYISVVYFPSLLLSSPTRAQQLKSGCARLILVLLGVLSVWKWISSHASLLYALHMHLTVYYFAEAHEPFVLIGQCFDAGLRLTGVAALIMYAWSCGPPLSVLPAPVGSSHCCAGLSHLAAVTLSELLLPFLLAGLDRVLGVQG